MYVEKINAMANAVNLREKLGETQDGESAKSVLNLMFLNIQKIINCGAVCAEYQTAAILSVKTFKSIRENEDFVDIYRKYGDGIESAKIAMKNLNGLYSRFVDGEPVFNVDFQNKEEILIACLNFLSECANLEFDRQTKLVTERVQKDNEPKVLDEILDDKPVDDKQKSESVTAEKIEPKLASKEESKHEPETYTYSGKAASEDIFD